jgi:predicted alpha/beta-fold hydrolase
MSESVAAPNPNAEAPAAAPPDVDPASLRKTKLLAALSQHPYCAPWWLRNGHGQTVYGPFFRRPRTTPTRRARLDTPDQDFINLHFCPGEPDMPTVLMLHGLGGCARSKYLLGLNAHFHAIGWTAVSLEFRGCGEEMNRAPRLYHSGDTTDLALALQRLRVSRGPVYAVGFSLGGNVLAKWLGETGLDAARFVRAAAVVSPPYDLTVSGPRIDRILGGVYAKHFVRSLVAKAVAKERQYPGILDIERVRRSRTLWEFDEYATAVLHGFAGADEYWDTQGCGQFLDSIRVPTLLISSADDPFNPSSTLPRDQGNRSPFLIPQFTERGGHVGFIHGVWPFRARYWAEEHVVRFFQLVEEMG